MSTIHIVTLSRPGTARTEIIGAFTTLDEAKVRMADCVNICDTACVTVEVQEAAAFASPSLTIKVRRRDGSTVEILDATQPHFFAKGTCGCVVIKGRPAGCTGRQEYVFWESDISSIISNDE